MSKTSAKTRVGRVTAILGAALLGFASASLAAEAASPAKTPDVSSAPPATMLKLTGTIEAVDKNVLGHATRVRIVTPDKGTFLIAKAGKGEDLMSHVGETVTVTAHRTQDAQGNEVLSVDGYQIHEG